MGNKVVLNIGEEYNDLMVISSERLYKRRAIAYRCRCKCGHEGIYVGSMLIRGIPRSCLSCSAKKRRFVKITKGDVFSSLTVISDDYEERSWKNGAKSPTKRRFYTCRCSCGSIGKFHASALHCGRAVSCATCAYKTRPQSTQRYSDMERLFRLSIHKRGKENTLTVEQFGEIVSKNCVYCNSPPPLRSYVGREMYANGVDRVNSSLGYTVDNCVPCCMRCNYMKSDMNLPDFLDQIEKIYRWKKQQEDTTQER